MNNRQKMLVNVLTGSRILFAAGLLCVPIRSVAFWICYLLGGLTDMLDGTIARKTHTASAFGAALDGIADLCFVGAAAIRLLPTVRLPRFVWYWAALIALLRMFALLLALCRKKPPFPHSPADKLTGGMLFLYPVLRQAVPELWAVLPICVAATVAAVWNFPRKA